MPRAFLLTLFLLFTPFQSTAQKAPAVVTRHAPLPKLEIEIKLTRSVVKTVDELELYVIITNNQNYAQTFLFDRPAKPGFGLWEAGCLIKGSSPENHVLKFAGKAEYFPNATDAALLSRHAYTIQPHEWFARKFSVEDIVVFNDKVCVNKQLPRDVYTLQLMFQGNYSNTVKFSVR